MVKLKIFKKELHKLLTLFPEGSKFNRDKMIVTVPTNDESGCKVHILIKDRIRGE